MKRKIFSVLAAVTALALSSCSMFNTVDSYDDDADSYIKISVNESRAALPSVSGVEGFDKFTLAGSAAGGTEVNKIWQTEGTDTAYKQMTADRIEVTKGKDYVFTLTAQKGGAVWKGSTTKTIGGGKNSIAFVLSLSYFSQDGSGSVLVTLAVPDAVKAVEAALKTADETEVVSVSGTPLTFADGKATYSASDIDSGSYMLIFTLYGDAEKTLKLADWREYVGITDDITSSSSPEIKTNAELESIYTLTFNLNDGTMAGAVPGSFTRYSDAIKLPTAESVIKNDYAFDGWYDNEELTGNAVTTLPAGTVGNKTFWAKWSDANRIDLSTLTANTVVEDGMILTGKLLRNIKITIADGATVTLDNVTINGASSCKWAGITLEGDAKLILKEDTTNTVKGFYSTYPGIFVPEGKTLTIEGTGTLNVSSNGSAPGIGGVASMYEEPAISCGNIVINDGVINAVGGYDAAGIGSGSSGSCGNITINGGTITATGGYYAPGIGSGNSGSCGDITISENVTAMRVRKGTFATVSLGLASGGTCGTVEIAGTVYYDGTDYQNNGEKILKGLFVFPIVESEVDYYTVKFSLNGATGTAPDDIQITVGESGTLPTTDVTREHYLFSGWNEKADGSGTTFYANSDATDLGVAGETITLYAYWNPQEWSTEEDKDGVTFVTHYLGDEEQYASLKGYTDAFVGGNYTVPDYVTKIDNNAFEDCTQLTAITIPDTIDSIGDYTFSGCTNLKSITIPDSVTSIGSYAFQNCSKLESLTIPASIAYSDVLGYGGYANGYGDHAIDGCTGLTSLVIKTNADERRFLDGSDWIFVKDGVEYSLYDESRVFVNGFADGADKENLEIPETISLGTEYTVLAVYTNAFENNTTLKTVTLPDTTALSIGERAFSGCTALQTVTGKLINVSRMAFANCSALTGIAFADVELDATLVARYNELKQQYNELEWQQHLLNYEDKDYYAKQDQIVSQMEAVENELRAVQKKLGTGSIGEWAFQNCTSLASVKIGSGVLSISSDAFDGCNTFASVVYNSTARIAGSDRSDGITFAAGGYKYAVRAKGKAALIHNCTEKNGEYWNFDTNTYTGSITIPETVKAGEGDTFTVTAIGFNAFSNCSGVTSVSIPDSVVAIEPEAFSKCTSLASLTLPEDVEYIGDRAFNHCSSLSTLHIPSKVMEIGMGAFEQSGLTELTIPDAVTSIERETISNCGSLEELTIGSGVENIDSYTIHHNPNLKQVIIKAATPPNVGENWLFYGCDALTDIVVPESSLEAYKTASGWSNFADRYNRYRAVIEKIDAIVSPVSFTVECDTSITEARAAYKALPKKQRALVTNYAKLTQAEADYAALKTNLSEALTDGSTFTVNFESSNTRGSSGFIYNGTFKNNNGNLELTDIYYKWKGMGEEGSGISSFTNYYGYSATINDKTIVITYSRKDGDNYKVTITLNTADDTYTLAVGSVVQSPVSLSVKVNDGPECIRNFDGPASLSKALVNGSTLKVMLNTPIPNTYAGTLTCKVAYNAGSFAAPEISGYLGDGYMTGYSDFKCSVSATGKTITVIYENNNDATYHTEIVFNTVTNTYVLTGLGTLSYVFVNDWNITEKLEEE